MQLAWVARVTVALVGPLSACVTFEPPPDIEAGETNFGDATNAGESGTDEGPEAVVFDGRGHGRIYPPVQSGSRDAVVVRAHMPEPLALDRS